MSIVVLAFWDGVVESLLGESVWPVESECLLWYPCILGLSGAPQFFSSFYNIFISRTYSSKSEALAVGDRGGTVLRVVAFRREILVGVHRLSVEICVDCVPVENDTVVSRKDTLSVDHSVVNLMEVVYLV